MADRAVRLRLVIIVVILGYLAIIVASHFVPLTVFLAGPLVITGWLFLLGLFLGARLRRIDTRPSAQPPIREMLRPWGLTAIFVAVAAVALFLAIGWDVPSFCHGPIPVNCVKGYVWSSDSGHYYHTTAAGIYAEISQQTYIQEVGFDLRSAAVFGVLALCAAWIGAAVFRPLSRAPD
jgi:branched-subunit amino acid ABC-type transport system permease component